MEQGIDKLPEFDRCFAITSPQAVPGDRPDRFFSQRQRRAVGVAPESVTVEGGRHVGATSFTGGATLGEFSVSIAAAGKIAGIKWGDELVVILFCRQPIICTVIFGKERIFRKTGDSRIDRKIAADIPVMEVTPLAAERMQMQQVLDEMLQQSPLLRCLQSVERSWVNREKGDAIPYGYPGSLSVKWPMFAAQVEDEMPIKGAFPQQPYHGVFKRSVVHASREMVWMASKMTLSYLSWAMASATSGILRSDLTKPKRRSRGSMAM